MGKKYRVGCRFLDEFGRGNISFNNRVFSVPFFLPGEIGQIELVFRAKETTAKLVSLEEPSEDRVTPVCPAFEKCGGCQLMHMSYEAQLRWKQSQVEALFEEEKEAGKIAPIIPMEHPWNYRYKVHATFSRGKKGEILVGLYEGCSHRIVSMDDCYIQNELANEIIKEVAAIMEKTKTIPYNEDSGSGVLRHVFIRTGKKTGQVLVALVTGSVDFKEKDAFVEGLIKKFPQITTIVHNINRTKSSRVLGKKESVLFGKGRIEDELCGLTFEISPKSFYQINPVQTEKLYWKAMEFAGLSGTETVLDAYCGIGTIGMLAAEKAKRVIGVESNEDAVLDAQRNAEKNNCYNVEFVEEDAGRYMMSCVQDKEGRYPRPEVVFMDPPRGGSDAKFLNALCMLAPDRIVYISCNPATQKSDTDYLKKNGYQIERMQAVDCFCHTYHVECVIMMQYCGKEKKK